MDLRELELGGVRGRYTAGELAILAPRMHREAGQSCRPGRRDERRWDGMVSHAEDVEENWFRRFHAAPEAKARLVCLPHAGGSATFYFPVSGALAPDIEVLAV